jgi:hypothetical protein
MCTRIQCLAASRWAKDTVARVGKAVGSLLVPGGPSITLTPTLWQPSTSVTPDISVRFVSPLASSQMPGATDCPFSPLPWPPP